MELEEIKHVGVCLERIRAFEKAARKYIKGQPTPEAAEVVLNRVFAELISSLEQPDVKKAVEGYLVKVQREAQATAKEILTDPSALDRLPMTQEWRVSDAMGFSKRKVRDVLVSHTHGQDIVVPLPATIQELRAKLVFARDAVVREVSLLRREKKVDLSTKQKRRRKRDILRGTTSSIHGAGIIVGNSVLIFGMGVTGGALSYALGGTAFFQATRDFIGEPK